MTRPAHCLLTALLAWAPAAAWAQEQLSRPSEPATEPATKGGYFEPEKPPAPAPAPPPLSAEQQDSLRRINAYRAAGATCGSQRFEPAPPLAWSAKLEQAAAAHARDMATRRAMSHSGGDGSSISDRAARVGYNWSALGENVSAGYKSMAEGLEGWIRSPGHCSNLMGPQFREVGLGAAQASGDTYGWYRAMVLGSQR